MGRGRYFRDEILAAIAWCERFPEVVQTFKFEGAMEFLPYLLNPDDPDSYERPFGFVQEMFDRRAVIVAETEAKIKVWNESAERVLSPEGVKEANGKRGPVPYNILEKAIKLILNSLSTARRRKASARKAKSRIVQTLFTPELLRPEPALDCF